TAKEEGKPEAALPRIVEGRVGGFFKDVVLVDQAAVWEDKKTVGQSLADGSTEVQRFVRFAVGA
ncbi:MAG: elongation factor Ts, partial [Propionibacteriaceae bacterium]|nr:elongation factor Ts [Propionibacteriaceae bacterium]